ncbi:MAG: Na+/H+ antiporter subunit E [Planctomycetota bacterium]
MTLTPGTLTVDLTDDGYLYVHWIYVKSDKIEEATQNIAQRFEYFLMKIFE